MPFDNPTGETVNKAEIAILDEMARLLARPEDWCQMTWYEERRDGTVARCLYGALAYANTGADRPETTKMGSPKFTGPATRVHEVLLSEAGGLQGWGLCTFNNMGTTTHADILDLIARAKDSFQRKQGGRHAVRQHKQHSISGGNSRSKCAVFGRSGVGAAAQRRVATGASVGFHSRINLRDRDREPSLGNPRS